jgi:hypothetical protein
MKTITMFPKSKEQMTTLKSFARALKIKFEVSTSPYSPDFVAKIKKGKKQVERGEFMTLDPVNPFGTI